jgi:hypothetical protein
MKESTGAVQHTGAISHYNRECLSLTLPFDSTPALSFFFFIKCKKCIDQKRARQACSTSWKPAEHYMHQQREQAFLNEA